MAPTSPRPDKEFVAAQRMKNGLDVTPAGRSPSGGSGHLNSDGCCAPYPVTAVNLGAWLILERWLVINFPGNPYLGTTAEEVPDTYTLMRHLRDTGGLNKLDEWYDTFVTKEKLQDLVAMGITSVRLPLGYWNVDASVDPSAPGYHTGTPFKQIDQLIDWAEELGLSVILDLHGAVGGQAAAMVSVSCCCVRRCLCVCVYI